MKFTVISLISFLSFFCNVLAQYAPQAGLTGSTAISATSGRFAAWATGCTIQRGFMDIANPTLGYASIGDSSQAIGPADDNTVSLGDSGIADLTFIHPIYNGPGPDFAVFENGFRNATDSSLAFLELGFVEVSSDGIHYFRFPANSLTQTQVQVSNNSYIDAANLNNLAGKYVGMYGTPFDLDDLIGIPGLDVNNITNVRIVDVVGPINGHASLDSAGRRINDPYPTPYPSCGFDLDAIGVIHELYESVKQLPGNISVNIYPNPASDGVVVSITNQFPSGLKASLTNITGIVLQQIILSDKNNEILMGQYPSGMYFLTLSDLNGNRWLEKITKR